jgi:hypothetical protein
VIRTIKVWCLYDPERRLIVKMHRLKRRLKPRAECVIVQLKGLYATARIKP